MKLEILAPVGDMDMLRAAVYSGADCIYLGIGALNARAGAEGFAGEGLRRAVSFCHARGCGVYAALNTLVLPGEEADFCRAVEDAAKAGCDGLILQDVGGAATAARIAPTMPRHASTQMSVHSPAGVEMLAGMGFSRVILAREMSEEEIEKTAQTARRLGVELEVFVHGALCVGVSGQCTLSAFLGGRSGNRGGCAGPCRLPFRAERASAGDDDPATDTFHLSLKDLSVLDALPRLAALGVASAKIEGRLRGPEYVAAAVDAAQKALRGEDYDRDWLAGVFSRSGFTDGWLTGAGGGEMFGVRSDTDTAAGKTALPKARELYRREAPRVPVRFTLTLSVEGARLLATDGTNEAVAEHRGQLAPAQKENDDALRATLAKTGGTPFYVENGGIELEAKGLFLSGGVLSALRRQALAALLALREAPGDGWPLVEAVCEPPLPASPRETARPRLQARFESLEQMSPPATGCEELLLPLWEAERVPEALRAKTRLWLPRVLFGAAEEKAKRAIDAAAGMGFKGFEAQNIAHLKLLKGLPVSGGFGLNAANGWSVAEYGRLGCERVTLSPELSLPQMRRALPADGPQTDALCYGHLPLMMTRACPLLAAGGDCEGCDKAGELIDRQGKAFALRCRDGVRQIYNPIPLWMGDRLAELPTDTATLYFTTETAAEAEAVLDAFAAGAAAPGAFTRGLYDRGTSRG